MVLGTASNVGKSILCTALCRIFYQDGISVAPFKAQNMSLNSAATPSGREIGRAQAVQAEAAGILPHEHMNPILLKPTGDMRTQVVLQGHVYDTVSARSYFASEKDILWQAVLESYRFLSEHYTLIVMEGAGSPVEMNLKARDIANLRVAEMANAAALLVADIDRGGVFASVVGTLQLMTARERQRIKGIVVNRFQGDPNLFQDGVRLLEEYAGIPVLGVIPYMPQIGIDEEDSVGLASTRYSVKRRDGAGEGLCVDSAALQIAIVRLPHIANFTDVDPLFIEPDVQAFFTSDPALLKDADAIVLPGTKNTMADLDWLRETGLLDVIRQLTTGPRPILGICGGYQMMGQQVLDPFHQEDPRRNACQGIGLFACQTIITQEKETVLVEGELLSPFTGLRVRGYEIHMGRTTGPATDSFARVSRSLEGKDPQHDRLEGTVADGGRLVGTYLHGILHNDEFRTRWLNQIRQNKGLPQRDVQVTVENVREDAYNRLADVVRSNLDLARLYELLADDD